MNEMRNPLICVNTLGKLLDKCAALPSDTEPEAIRNIARVYSFFRIVSRLRKFHFRLWPLRVIINGNLYSEVRGAMSSQMIEQLLDKAIQILQNDNLKKKIELHLLQPFMQHAIELVFPYVIIICAVFGVLIIVTTSILCILVFKITGGGAVASAGASAAAASVA
jgi:small-conductance mechanosensitive channel